MIVQRNVYQKKVNIMLIYLYFVIFNSKEWNVDGNLNGYI